MRFVVRGALLVRAFGFFFLSSFFQTMMEKKQFLRERERVLVPVLSFARVKKRSLRAFIRLFSAVYEYVGEWKMPQNKKWHRRTRLPDASPGALPPPRTLLRHHLLLD